MRTSSLQQLAKKSFIVSITLKHWYHKITINVQANSVFRAAEQRTTFQLAKFGCS